ncbi:MAG: hypothetical protein WBO17_15415 [Sphingorhabdus sp.]
MVNFEMIKLDRRSAQLKFKLTNGSQAEIDMARELLRLSLVELYELGYWRDQPHQFRTYMRLFRTSRAGSVNVLPSMSAIDKRAPHIL